uniref:Pre-mRNA splicing Prp18-interacting factor n=1 Tax=Tanacetum cinerariifolium TaxID=118510 RepID=A0A6L2N0H6_TANCI|nr:hypothetical protein [Tanacetum cinerariifolium]
MTSFGYRLNPRYAIKECLSCGALYTRDFCCSKGNVEDKILVPKHLKNCARCGHPVDGPYCQGCALLREKLEEDLVTYFQNFQNTFESSDDSTNVVNAPQEPFVVKQDHDVNSSQDPPHIDECCYVCGDALDGIFCQQCTCKSCGKDAHIGHNYPPKVLIISNPEPCNQTMNNEPPQLCQIPACCDDDDDYNSAITPFLSTEKTNNSLSMRDENLDTIPTMESDEVIKSSVEDLVPIPGESEGIFDTMCDVHLVNNPTPFEAKDHFEIVINSNDDISSSDDDSLYNENIEYVEASPRDSEVISLEVAEIVIPKDEEIQDDNLHEKLLNVNFIIAKIEALKDNPTPSFEFLTKSSSTSPKSFLEETNTFDNSLPEFENFCFDLEEISSGSTTTHSDISLSDYEAFYFDDDHIEEIISGGTTTHSDISLSDYEAFYFDDDHIEEIISGGTTTHSDISLSEYDSFIFDLSNDQFPPTDRSDSTHEEFADELAHIISSPEYDCFYFRNLPDPGEWIHILNSEIRENLSSTTRVKLPVEDDHSPLLAYVVWILLAYLTYPVIPPYLHSFGNEDTIFDPGIAINRFYSFKPGLSHQCGTFKKFNTHRGHLNESPMEIIPGNLKTLAKGFYLPSLHFLSFNWESRCQKPGRLADKAGTFREERSLHGDYIPRLLYDNSSPRPPEEFVSENSNADAESFSPFPIRIEDSNSFMEEIDLTFTPDDPMPHGIKEDDDESRDILICEELLDNYSLPLPENESFHFDIPLSSRPPAKPTDGAHYGYNCPSKVPIIPDPEPFNNQTIDEFPQTVLSFDPTCKLMEQLTSMCDMVGQYIQKKEEEKQIEEEQAAKVRYWKIPACYDDDDDDDDYTIAITHKEPDNSLSMGDGHLDTIPATESDEFIKSSVENLVPNPSDDDQSFSDKDISKEIYLNPLFDEEIISMKIDPHHFNTESDLIESLLNRDSPIISSSSKIDSLFDEFAGELTLLKSILPGINKIDCDPEEETRFTKKLLYDNSSPQIDLSFTPDDPISPVIKEDDYDSERDILILEEWLSNDSLSLPENESFHFEIPSSSRPPAKPPDGNTGILNVKVMGGISEHKVPMPRLMLTRVPNQEKSPKLLSHLGHEAFQPSAEYPMMIYGKNTPILDVPFFHFCPLDQFKYGGIGSS